MLTIPFNTPALVPKKKKANRKKKKELELPDSNQRLRTVVSSVITIIRLSVTQHLPLSLSSHCTKSCRNQECVGMCLHVSIGENPCAVHGVGRKRQAVGVAWIQLEDQYCRCQCWGSTSSVTLLTV